MENEEFQTFKTNRRFLKRYRKSLAKIDRLKDRLFDINEKINKIKSPNFSGMPKGGTPPSLAEMISDKIELEERIQRQIEKSREIRREVLEKIDDLEDELQAEVLEAFFIQSSELSEIADQLGYSERYIASIYSAGIKAVQLDNTFL